MTGAAAYAQRVRDERERFRVARQLAETERVMDDILQAPGEPIKKFYSWDHRPNSPSREARFLVTLVTLGIETLDKVRASIELTGADAKRLRAHATPALLVKVEESINLRGEILKEFDRLIAEKSEVNDGCKKNNRGSQLRIRRLRKTKRNNGASLSRTLRGSKSFIHLRRRVSA